MTPSEVKRYLTERRIAPLHDIALHFDMDPDAVRGMLGHWVRKGRVRIHQDDGCQNGCCGGCGEHAVKEVYEWLRG
jgi:putative ferrous iron transport protein C